MADYTPIGVPYESYIRPPATLRYPGDEDEKKRKAAEPYTGGLTRNEQMVLGLIPGAQGYGQVSQMPGQGLTDYNRRTMASYRQAAYGGSGVGDIPTIGGAGGEQALLELDQARKMDPYTSEIIGRAAQTTRDIEAGAESIPYGPGGYSIPLLEQGLRRQIEAPGMSPVEYTQAKRRITQGFQAQTGALAAGQAKGGYFSPTSVAQAGGGAPSQELATGMAELEAKNAEIQRREREAGVRTLASQYGTLSGQALQPRQAYGEEIARLRTTAPVTRQGVYPTKYSSTAMPTYSSLPSQSGSSGIWVG
jgi:hypothetical protein